ncbi:MAG: DUF418 domain-containing protein [Acidobacteria bacterium]|nr:DUF418 domain-containing protein [Acidobacteriota bacterium]
MYPDAEAKQPRRVLCPQPVSPSDRLARLDIIRGLALFGVLIVNIEAAFRIPLLEHIVGLEQASATVADQVVDLVVARGLEFKALTIFSFLFGVGVAIQAERTTQPFSFLARRLGWLYVFGLLHLLLIWNGDILALYAVSGLLLLPALGLRWPALLVIGAVIMVTPEALSFNLPLPRRATATTLIEEARTVYSSGSLVSIFRFRLRETEILILPLLANILPRTAGLMFWGMAGWRSGILHEPHRHRGKLLAALALGLPLGLLNPSVPLLLALAYLAGLLLLLTSRRASGLSGLAAVGRMSLTNYLTQSIVLGFVFYGYGLGLLGRVGSAAAFCIGIALFAPQVQISRVWLRRFRYGPAEWLWRSMAYGVRQPILAAPPAVARSSENAAIMRRSGRS